MSAGTRYAATMRFGAALLLAVAIALGFTDEGRAATTKLGEPNLPAHRARAADRTFREATAALPAHIEASSLSRDDNRRTWLVAVVLIAVTGASIAAGARSLRAIRRKRAAAAPVRSIGSLSIEPLETRHEAVEPAPASQSPRRLAAGEPVIGYLTASNGEGDAGDEGEAAIDAACAGAGWDLLEIVRDRDQGARSLERPGLSYALGQIASSAARGLVVADVRRLCRSIVDLGTLVRWFHDARATLVALDLGLDTSTPEGRHAAHVLMTLGVWEHERIAQRTRVGLADVKARGGFVGRPAISDVPGLRERIAGLRASGMTLQAIADQLNAEGVPTMRGGARWRPSSVQGALGYRRPSGRKNVR